MLAWAVDALLQHLWGWQTGWAITQNSETAEITGKGRGRATHSPCSIRARVRRLLSPTLPGLAPRSSGRIGADCNRVGNKPR